MIKKEEFQYFNYVKKEELTGSIEGLRYMLKKSSAEEGEQLETVLWQGPLNYNKTPEEKKIRRNFPFSQEGVEMAADWINERYEAEKERWEKGKKLLP